ncbi:MAG: hypothetical protein ACJ786_04490, partial [Catenulispora sp.]
HALVDARAAEYARLVQTAMPDLMSTGAHRRARIAEIGAGMIARLPAFPDAPLDELLDVKRELHGALDRYRAVVSELEQLVQAGLGAVDMDSELDDLWIRKVRPALTDLEENFIEHGFVRELARSTATSAKSLVTQGAALYIALSTLADLASHLSAAAAVAGIASEAAANAALSMSTARTAARRDDFFYLHELQRRGAR